MKMKLIYYKILNFRIVTAIPIYVRVYYKNAIIITIVPYLNERLRAVSYIIDNAYREVLVMCLCMCVKIDIIQLWFWDLDDVKKDGGISCGKQKF